MEPKWRDVDRNIAENLRVIRGSSGLSQTVVARKMSERGWPWHQTTVRRVESGDQGITGGEGRALAEALGVTYERLCAPSEGAAEVAAAEQVADNLRLSWIEAVKGVRHLREATGRARDALPGAKASTNPRVREIAEVIAARLEECTFDSAVAESEKEQGS